MLHFIPPNEYKKPAKKKNKWKMDCDCYQWKSTNGWNDETKST
jgi:hypothetical protein